MSVSIVPTFSAVNYSGKSAKFSTTGLLFFDLQPASVAKDKTIATVRISANNFFIVFSPSNFLNLTRFVPIQINYTTLNLQSQSLAIYFIKCYNIFCNKVIWLSFVEAVKRLRQADSSAFQNFIKFWKITIAMIFLQILIKICCQM